MKKIRSFKIELDANNKQRTLFRQHVGAARFTYNWGLNRIQQNYQEIGEFPSAYDLAVWNSEQTSMKQEPCTQRRQEER